MIMIISRHPRPLRSARPEPARARAHKSSSRRDRKFSPKYLLDLKGLEGMEQLEFDPKKGMTIGAAVNMKFHPTAVGETEAARRKWVSLLRTYFRLGGAQLQPTCVSAETLRAAQQDPEQYRDLIVKVGGYSTYFVDLGREIQDEVIGRTEHR